MVFGTGVDIIEINRIEKSVGKEHFVNRVFSQEEIILFKNKKKFAETAAVNFCGKEAFAKAIGTGVKNFALKEVSILRDTMGKPYIYLEGNAKKIACEMGLNFEISLSHCKEYAVAFVIAYKK